VDNIYKLIFILILIAYSNIAAADTYPAVTGYQNPNTGVHYGSLSAACTSIGTQWVPDDDGLRCKSTDSFGNVTYRTNMTYSSCPAGGSLSGSTCIDAPVCDAGLERNLTTGICEAPAECPAGQFRNTNPVTGCQAPTCPSSSSTVNFSPVFDPDGQHYTCQSFDVQQCTPPETDNGYGICGVAECLTSEVLNPSTGVCQVPPNCASAERYDASSNSCVLRPLECPGNSHPNTANDQCLPNAPLACPSGQHDDGTYNCIADDVSACNSNQQAGMINGTPQCITKPNLDTAQQAAEDAAQNFVQKSTDLKSAATANQSAQTALAANPSDSALQSAATGAAAELETARAEAEKASSEAMAAAQAVQSDYLNSIDQTLKGEKAKDDADRKAGFGEVPDSDVLTETPWEVSTGTISNTSGSCPAAETMNTGSVGAITISYQPMCDFASMVRPLIIAFAWLSAALISYGAVKG